MIDNEAREFDRYATPYLREHGERDVCSYCLRELLVGEWSCTLVYRDERFTRGVHACFPVTRLGDQDTREFWQDVWDRSRFDDSDDYVATEGRTKDSR
jgi:hypothetical protein